MDQPNAFIGKTEKPSEEELFRALGSSSSVWKELIGWLADKHGVTTQEWKSYSPKFGWSMQVKLKKRTIVHLSPRNGSFQAVFILGDRAVEAAKQSKPSQSLTKILQEAPKYPEGTGIRLNVKATKDLATIRKLAEIKLAN